MVNCPHTNCRERLFMSGNIWIENSKAITSGTCFKHGTIKFTLGERKNATPDDATTGAIAVRQDMRD